MEFIGAMQDEVHPCSAPYTLFLFLLFRSRVYIVLFICFSEQDYVVARLEAHGYRVQPIKVRSLELHGLLSGYSQPLFNPPEHLYDIRFADDEGSIDDEGKIDPSDELRSRRQNDDGIYDDGSPTTKVRSTAKARLTTIVYDGSPTERSERIEDYGWFLVMYSLVYEDSPSWW